MTPVRQRVPMSSAVFTRPQPCAPAHAVTFWLRAIRVNMLFTRKSHDMPAPADTLPGRGPNAGTGPTACSAPRSSRLSRRARAGDVRDGLLLGRRAQVLEAARRLLDRGRATPAASRRTRPTRRCAPGGPGTPRPCWSSTTRRRSPTTTCSRRSGRATTRPRGCGRATTSARSTARRSTRRRPAARPRRVEGARTQKALDAGRLTATITTEIAGAGRSTTPRTTTSSTWRKNPGGYCGIGGTGVACPDRHRRRRLSSLRSGRPY